VFRVFYCVGDVFVLTKIIKLDLLGEKICWP